MINLKRYFYSITGILFLIFVALPCQTFADQKRIVAKASFAEKSFDFGTVSAGTIVSHAFSFKSVGNTSYKVARIVSGCGCTAVSSSDESIEPGDSGFIKVDFDTTGFSGKKSKMVRVYSNDIDNPELTLTISGTVVSDVEIVPPTVFLGEIVQGSSPEPKSFSVSVRKESGFKISSVTSFSKFFKIEALESGAAKSGSDLHSYKVRVDPLTPVGEIRDRILVNLQKDTVSSYMTVPVLGKVVGLISIEPAQISFGIVEGSKILERSATLTNKGTEPVEVLSVRSDSDAVSAEFEPIEAGRKYLIKVKVDPELLKSDMRALIEIKTSSAEQSALYLSVFGVTPPKLNF